MLSMDHTVNCWGLSEQLFSNNLEIHGGDQPWPSVAHEMMFVSGMLFSGNSPPQLDTQILLWHLFPGDVQSIILDTVTHPWWSVHMREVAIRFPKEWIRPITNWTQFSSTSYWGSLRHFQPFCQLFVELSCHWEESILWLVQEICARLF